MHKMPVDTSRIEEGSGTGRLLGMAKLFITPSPFSEMPALLLKLLVHEPAKGWSPEVPLNHASRLIPPVASLPPKAVSRVPPLTVKRN